jgi:hypothetical protein
MQPGNKIAFATNYLARLVLESVMAKCILSGLSRFPLKTSRPFAMLVFLGADFALPDCP